MQKYDGLVSPSFLSSAPASDELQGEQRWRIESLPSEQCTFSSSSSVSAPASASASTSNTSLHVDHFPPPDTQAMQDLEDREYEKEQAFYLLMEAMASGGRWKSLGVRELRAVSETVRLIWVRSGSKLPLLSPGTAATFVGVVLHGALAVRMPPSQRVEEQQQVAALPIHQLPERPKSGLKSILEDSVPPAHRKPGKTAGFVHVRTLVKGDVFGELAFFHPQALRTEEVIVEGTAPDEVACVAVLHYSQLQELNRAHPALALKLMRVFLQAAFDSLSAEKRAGAPFESLPAMGHIPPDNPALMGAEHNPLLHLLRLTPAAALPRNVTQQDLRILARHMSLMTLTQGTRLTREGDRAQYTFLLFEGSLAVEQSRVKSSDPPGPLQLIHSGRWVGGQDFVEAFAHTGGLRESGLVAHTDVTFAAMSLNQLAALQTEIPEIAMMLLSQLATDVINSLCQVQRHKAPEWMSRETFVRRIPLDHPLVDPEKYKSRLGDMRNALSRKRLLARTKTAEGAESGNEDNSGERGEDGVGVSSEVEIRSGDGKVGGDGEEVEAVMGAEGGIGCEAKDIEEEDLTRVPSAEDKPLTAGDAATAEEDGKVKAAVGHGIFKSRRVTVVNLGEHEIQPLLDAMEEWRPEEEELLVPKPQGPRNELSKRRVKKVEEADTDKDPGLLAWKRRALASEAKLRQQEAELNDLRRRVHPLHQLVLKAGARLRDFEALFGPLCAGPVPGGAAGKNYRGMPAEVAALLEYCDSCQGEQFRRDTSLHFTWGRSNKAGTSVYRQVTRDASELDTDGSGGVVGLAESSGGAREGGAAWAPDLVPNSRGRKAKRTRDGDEGRECEAAPHDDQGLDSLRTLQETLQDLGPPPTRPPATSDQHCHSNRLRRGSMDRGGGSSSMENLAGEKPLPSVCEFRPSTVSLGGPLHPPKALPSVHNHLLQKPPIPLTPLEEAMGTSRNSWYSSFAARDLERSRRDSRASSHGEHHREEMRKYTKRRESGGQTVVGGIVDVFVERAPLYTPRSEARPSTTPRQVIYQTLNPKGQVVHPKYPVVKVRPPVPPQRPSIVSRSLDSASLQYERGGGGGGGVLRSCMRTPRTQRLATKHDVVRFSENLQRASEGSEGSEVQKLTNVIWNSSDS